jgi:hypothetical protein
LKREKVGTHKAACDLLIKCKNEICEGIRMPENMRHTAFRFKTFCDDILVFSKKHHRDFRSVEIRIRNIVAEFGEKPVDKIKPPRSTVAVGLRRRPPLPTLPCVVLADLPRGHSKWQAVHTRRGLYNSAPRTTVTFGF